MTLEKKETRKPRRAAIDVLFDNATKLPISQKIDLINALKESIDQERKTLTEQINAIEQQLSLIETIN